MKNKSNVFISLAYLFAIFFLAVWNYRSENLLTHLYWTRVAIFILIGICALFNVVDFIRKVFIKDMKSTWISNINFLITLVYIILLVVNITL